MLEWSCGQSLVLQNVYDATGRVREAFDITWKLRKGLINRLPQIRGSQFFICRPESISLVVQYGLLYAAGGDEAFHGGLTSFLESTDIWRLMPVVEGIGLLMRTWKYPIDVWSCTPKDVWMCGKDGQI